MLTHTQLLALCDTLELYNATASDFFAALLGADREVAAHRAACFHNITLVLAALDRNTTTQEPARRWACEVTTETCRKEILALTCPEAGLHFRAKHATEAQLESFDLGHLADQMNAAAPTLSSILCVLLDSDSERQAERRRRYRAVRRGKQTRKEKESKDSVSALHDVSMDIDGPPPQEDAHTGDARSLLERSHPRVDGEQVQTTGPGTASLQMTVDAADESLFWGDDLPIEPLNTSVDGEDDEGLYWDDRDFIALDAEGDLDEADMDKDMEELEVERWKKILTLVRKPHTSRVYSAAGTLIMLFCKKTVVITSILLQSTNQQCNALQSTVGVYLHACRASESVVELLARIGVSISRSSIDSSVISLSKESHISMQALGRTMRAGYGFDNFDVEDKHAVPTVERSHDTLLHLTSGTILRLDHGVTLEDLRCSDEVWNRLHPSATEETSQHVHTPEPNWKDLMDIHPDVPHTSGLTRRQRFNRWKFLDDLVRHGPEYFRQFAGDLGEPEIVDQIPLVKSQQVPTEGMDINQSTVQGNADALEELFRQGGVGDPEESAGVTAVGDHVILVHGDLATCERVQSLQESRMAEKTPWRRLQHVVFVMGLFHLKMACADAIWKIFIKPKSAHEDPTSLMAYVAEIRPKETGKIASKPGFRRMHDVIKHVGIASRLDCWREELKKSCKVSSLEDWAATEPSWDRMEELATQITQSYVPTTHLSAMRSQPPDIRDQQWENTLLREQYFLLYEELSYAMNAGDIGRVETCFMPWVFIFRGCGKHKYATQMVKFLHNVHHVYPPGLRRAIRLNILCNPSGKKHHFRAIDWWVEHNNLYIKRIYGGAFSNRTKRRILKQAALVEVYKKVRISFEEMFALDHRTYRHAAPKIARTLRKLREYMKTHDAHVPCKKRASRHNIPDMVEAGIFKLMGLGPGVDEPADAEDGVDGELDVNGHEGDLEI